MRRALLRSLLLLTAASSALQAAPSTTSRALHPRAGGPVFISSCAVMFGVRSSAASSTRAGLFGSGKAGEMRTDTDMQRIYLLTGLDTATFQRITDALCGDAPKTLAAAGYQLHTDSARTHFIWADKDSAGQVSPQEQKMGQTRYLVFSQTGSLIGDPMVVGGVKGVKIQGWDVTIGKQYGLRPVNILYTVDFASVEALKRNSLVGQNWANVTAKLAVTVGATITAVDPVDAKCSRGAPFGKHKNREFCLLKGNKALEAGRYQTAEEEERAFADPIASVTESTTAGQQMVEAVSGLTTALSGAMGMRSARRADIAQYDVAVDLAKYEARVLEGAKGVLAAAMAAIDNPAGRKGSKE